jgi:hypothetical protein
MVFVDYFDQFIQEKNLINESIFSIEDLYSWFEKRYPTVDAERGACSRRLDSEILKMIPRDVA